MARDAFRYRYRANGGLGAAGAARGKRGARGRATVKQALNEIGWVGGPRPLIEWQPDPNVHMEERVCRHKCSLGKVGTR